MKPSQLRRLLKFRKFKHDLLFYLRENPTYIRGQRMNKALGYAKPRLNDFPMTAVLVNTSRLLMVEGVQHKFDAVSVRVINPFRLPFGEVGRSRHSPAKFRLLDARLHERKFKLVGAVPVTDELGRKVKEYVFDWSEVVITTLKGERITQYLYRSKKGVNIQPVIRTVKRGGILAPAYGKSNSPEHEVACLLSPS